MPPGTACPPTSCAHDAKLIDCPELALRLGDRCRTKVVLGLRLCDGVKVSNVLSADHVAAPATAGPVTLPSWSTTSNSIPGIIEWLKPMVIDAAGSTPVAPPLGSTLDTATSASGARGGAVEPLHPLRASGTSRRTTAVRAFMRAPIPIQGIMIGSNS